MWWELRTRRRWGMAVGRFIVVPLVVGTWGCQHSDTEQMAQSSSVEKITCPRSTKVLVNSAKPTVTVSYQEPTRSSDDTLLQDLVKTTIYFDVGDGTEKAMEVPATNPKGGGRITQTITIPVKGNKDISAVICVTATDISGNEGSPTP